MEVKLSCNINEQVVCLKQWRLSSIQNTPFSTSFIYPITPSTFQVILQNPQGDQSRLLGDQLNWAMQCLAINK